MRTRQGAAFAIKQPESQSHFGCVDAAASIQAPDCRPIAANLNP